MISWIGCRRRMPVVTRRATLVAELEALPAKPQVQVLGPGMATVVDSPRRSVRPMAHGLFGVWPLSAETCATTFTSTDLQWRNEMVQSRGVTCPRSSSGQRRSRAPSSFVTQGSRRQAGGVRRRLQYILAQQAPQPTQAQRLQHNTSLPLTRHRQATSSHQHTISNVSTTAPARTMGTHDRPS